MNRITVIGVGSPMDGDRIAWEVIDLLAESADLPIHPSTELSFIKSDRPGSRLLEYMQTADVVILLDALQAEQTQAYRCLSPQQLQDENVLLSSHGFGVAEALQLAKAISSLPPELLIYGIANWAKPLDIVKAMVEELGKRLEKGQPD